MSIDAYLEALGRELGGDPLFRRRVLREVEDHLRESAAGVGEEEAIVRFGAPEEVARRFGPERQASAAAWLFRVVVLCLGGFLAASVAAENLLPPAPWPSAADAPWLVRVPTQVAVWIFVAAVAAAVLRATRVAALAVGLASLFALVGGLRRAQLYEELGVAGRLSPLELALGAIWLASLAASALGVLVWATAQRASRSNGLSR